MLYKHTWFLDDLAVPNEQLIRLFRFKLESDKATLGCHSISDDEKPDLNTVAVLAKIFF